MINSETERELVVAAYHGTTNGYEAIYSFRYESLYECQKYLIAIDALKVDGLITVQSNYSKNTSSTPSTSTITLTRYGIDYIEENEVVDKTAVANHKKARRLLQEMEDAERVGDTVARSVLEVSFQQLDSKIQLCAKAYKDLI